MASGGGGAREAGPETQGQTRIVRLFSWFVVVPTALAVVAFSVSNRAEVIVDFWPLPITSEFRVFAVVLVSIFAGFVLGGLVAWISGGKRRWRARAMARRAKAAEAEVARLRDRGADLEEVAEKQEIALPAPPPDAA